MLYLNSKVPNIAFKKNYRYSADQYIADLENVEKKRVEGGIYAKAFGSPTASLAGTSVMAIGEGICLGIMKSKNAQMMSQKLKNSLILSLLGFIALGAAIWVSLQKWQNELIENNDNTKVSDLLVKYGSDTSAKMSDKNLRKVGLGAQYNAINGVIEVNKNFIYDPLTQRMLEKFIKHEIQHARQFEMIAGLDDGIEKLNFAIMYNTASRFKNHRLVVEQIKNIAEELNNDKTGLYDGVTVPLSGAQVDLKKYIKGLEILINNPNAKPEDIPMIIDVEHYKEAIAKRGPLSEEEKVKAEEYYQAWLNYPSMTGLNLINPFSGYRSNILEKEARKAGRSKTGKIEY